MTSQPVLVSACAYEAENRLAQVVVGNSSASAWYTLFEVMYDGAGWRVKKAQNGQTTVYVGNVYEKRLSSGVVTKYYYANGQRVAMRQVSTV